MGPLPAPGQWVRLEVPASQVGLDGQRRELARLQPPELRPLHRQPGQRLQHHLRQRHRSASSRPTGRSSASYSQGFSYAQGCVVDRNDHVWIAHSLNGGTVGHMKSDGTYVGNVTVGSGPTGVAVDGKGKIWATNYYSRTVSRIDPARGPLGPDGVTRVGAVDFTTRDLGGNPYNYSDMTGSTLTAAPLSGTWSVIFDSKVAGAEWGRVGWAAQRLRRRAVVRLGRHQRERHDVRAGRGRDERGRPGRSPTAATSRSASPSGALRAARAPCSTT